MALMCYSFKFLALMTLMAAHVAASDAVIQYHFNDRNGIVDQNSFGAGVTAGKLTQKSGDLESKYGPMLWSSTKTSPQSRIGARFSSQGGAMMGFSITIPKGTVVDLKSLSFEQGLDFYGVSMTPLLEVSISAGGKSLMTTKLNHIGHQNKEGTFTSLEKMALHTLRMIESCLNRA